MMEKGARICIIVGDRVVIGVHSVVEATSILHKSVIQLYFFVRLRSKWTKSSVKGQLNIKMRDREIHLKEGEFFIVPRGVEHLPYANEETHVLLFEPKLVVNTGDTVSEKTVEAPEWI